METVFPFLEKINKIGFEHLNDVKCQKVCKILCLFHFSSLNVEMCQELFCEMVVMGNSKEANFVQSSLAAMVHYTPTFVANAFGVKKVLQVITKSSYQYRHINTMI